MPKIKFTVEPKSKTDIGWFVKLFSWRANERDLVTHQIKLDKNASKDGKFVFESKADLPSRTYGIQLHLIGSGSSASLTVSGKPAILYPANKTWPVSLKVPSEFTQETDEWFFSNGGGV